MPRPEKSRNLNFYTLNVKLRINNSSREATEKEYLDLFKKVQSQKIHKESSPGKHCIFQSLFTEKNEGGTARYIYGTFADFTHIQNERWFNLDKLDLDNEFKIPTGLFPDAKITEYIFIPSAHRFIYRHHSRFNVPPYSIKNFLQFALDAVSGKNLVQVDVESSKSTIDRILKAQIVKKLIIDVNYSNHDIGTNLQEFYENDIKPSNVSRIVIEATQKKDESIDITKSKILRGAIESSVSNGETTATVVEENNRTITLKTSDAPYKDFVHGVTTMFFELVYEKITSIFRPTRKKGNKK